MMKVVEWIVANWMVIIALIAVVVVAITAVKKFMELPTSEQKSKVMRCLLGWVIDAEKEFGGGTGKVKLSTVYGLFVTSFPIIKNFISFDTFSLWVDEALEEMRKMLEENSQLNEVVTGNIVTTETSNTKE